MNSSTIDAAKEFIGNVFKSNVDGHDANHSIRVYQNAMYLAGYYPNCDTMIIALAALLHDVDDHKLFATENNANARHFLEMYHIEPEKREQICNAINTVSFSMNRGKTPKSIEGKIVQDADRLDAIGAIGIARTFAFGGRCDRPLEASLQHFHEKLLLLKNEMNTDEAKHIAESRHAFMEAFLKEIDIEMNPLVL